MLGVSRLIHLEAAHTLYGSNLFRLLSREAGDIPKWFQSIGYRNRILIRYLRIDTDILLREIVGCALPWVTGLEDFKLAQRPLIAKIERTGRNAPRWVWNSLSMEIMEANMVSETDFRACLEILEELTHIARLELNVPRKYYMHRNRHDPAPKLTECGVSENAFKAILESLPKLHIKSELRVSEDHVSRDFEDVVKGMTMEEAAIFNNRIAYMDPIPPTLDSKR